MHLFAQYLLVFLLCFYVYVTLLLFLLVAHLVIGPEL